jgi:hypothetical protein
MIYNQRNSEKILKLSTFCLLYEAHRDFVLAKTISRHKPLSYENAERLSSFINQIVKTKKSEPRDFIPEENQASNEVIEAYLVLKDSLREIKEILGTKAKNDYHKTVKLFYRKKTFCYQMDTYFCHFAEGLFLYSAGIIVKDFFVLKYCNEICLFTGKRSPIDVRKAFKIGQYILNIIENGNTKKV